MKFVPATFHGFLDYAVALTLIAAPFIFGEAGGFTEIAKYFYIVIGAAVVVVVAVTNPTIESAH